MIIVQKLAVDIRDSISPLSGDVDVCHGIKYVKGIFAKYDDDGSNCLDQEELYEAISKGLGVDVAQAEFDLLWPIIDADGSGSVDCEEFVELCMAQNPEAKAMTAFAKAQADKAMVDMQQSHKKAILVAILQFVFLVSLGAIVMANIEDW